MTRLRRNLRACYVLFAACVLACLQARAAEKSSPLFLDTAGKRLFVANADSASVSVVDTDTLTVGAEIPVGRSPQAVWFDAARGRLLVTNQDEDTLAVVDAGTGQLQACVPLGDEPFGVVANARHVFISNGAAGSVIVKDGASLDTLAEIAVSAEPRGLSLSGDGKLLYVTHFLSGRITVIDTATFTVAATIDTGSGALLAQNLVLDPASTLAYAPQTLANTANTALLFDTTVAPVVAVIDTAQRVNRRGDRIALDLADEPVSIPLDAAIAGDGTLYVVNAGSNDVSVVDMKSNRGVAHLQTGANPRSIVLDAAAGRAYAGNALDGSVTVIDTAARRVLRAVVVTTPRLSSRVLEGKRLFNSADDPVLAKDQWIACSTCHFDGRHDGRTWFFPDGPRNTPILQGVAATLPMHWSGDLDELHDVESTIRNIQAGTGLAAGGANCEPACDRAPPNAGRSARLDALAAYMETLEVPVTPLQMNPFGASASAQRGKLLFNAASVGCAGCHAPPRYTDNLMHDVGTGANGNERKGSRFNTPSLLGLERTAPYMHDGSQATLLDVLVAARSGKHGNTNGLGATELDDLRQFLLELAPPVSNAAAVAPCGLPRAPTAELRSNASGTAALARGSRLLVTADVDSSVGADLYLGVIFPDGSFKTLQPDGRFGAPGDVTRARRVAATRGTVAMLDYVVQDALPAGTYTLVLVSTLPGAAFANRQHWLDIDRVELALPVSP